nr:hypothetical protein [Tanacetum cinerariifolium]
MLACSHYRNVSKQTTRQSRRDLPRKTTLDRVEVLGYQTTTTTTVTIPDSTRPKARGVVMQEPSEATTTTIIPLIKSQDNGKGIMVELEMPLKKKGQTSLDEEFAFKLQAEEDEQERIIREKAQQIEEVNLAWDDV